MGRIHVMDPHLAAKIAAGEVIERPASVVKELVENALDAGATWVRVEVDGGGTERIVVADDGAGIAADDVELAFRRHATSKLAREADLEGIVTLGFRGEALPSIAAVADVRCVTRSVGEPVGTELVIEAGAIEARSVGRGQAGTTFEVERLFGRFPARRKFLRARSAEAAACAQVVGPLALAFPEVRFTLLLDGREALRTPGDGDLRSAAAAVLGEDTRPHLVPVAESLLGDDGQSVLVRVAGLCATGSWHRAGRGGVYLLLNRRPIQNRSLSYAVQEAYGSLLPVGRHPVAVLAVAVPPGEVDFNVHPSKLEVKLLRERAVYATLQRAVRGGLSQGDWQPPAWPAESGWPAEGAGPAGLMVDPGLAGVPGLATGAAGPAPDGGPPDLLSGGERLADLRVLGQAGATYVVAEGDAGVYLVDQHAAHERVLLEELRAALSGRAERQLLLEPLVVDVPPEAVLQVASAEADLAQLGFDLQPFGRSQVLLRAVPAVVAQRQPGRVVGEALAALADNSHGLSAAEPGGGWIERLALVLACKTAVRAGDGLAGAEMERLLRRLGEAELCRTCAHGRPTAILLDFRQLERAFGRR